MSINTIIEEQKTKSHIEWLSKADTAVINSSERTVISYGFLSQAVGKSLKEAIKQILEAEVERLKGMKRYWKPTCGYDSEEECGFQKGIIAEQELTNQRIDDQITHLTNIIKEI